MLTSPGDDVLELMQHTFAQIIYYVTNLGDVDFLHRIIRCDECE